MAISLFTTTKETMSTKKTKIVQAIILTAIIGSVLGLWITHESVCDRGDFFFVSQEAGTCPNKGN